MRPSGHRSPPRLRGRPVILQSPANFDYRLQSSSGARIGCRYQGPHLLRRVGSMGLLGPIRLQLIGFGIRCLLSPEQPLVPMLIPVHSHYRCFVEYDGIGVWVALGGSVVRELQPGDPQTIGSYRLVGQLGGGGMGRVFLGVSAGGRPVAVKVIRAELAADPQFRMRSGREVAAARRVSGVFTAMVVDADVDGPAPWLATAYVPGPSLSEAVDDHGPLPAGSLLALAAGLAESLTAIHAAGVVHRDLKPSNVMLAEDGPRVIDFGISRAVESTALTQTGLVIGSPGFMSPEQAMGLDVGPPSDIFNLGAVLAFAATGVGPFGSGTTVALLYRVVHGSPSLDQVPAEV